MNYNHNNNYDHLTDDGSKELKKYVHVVKQLYRIVHEHVASYNSLLSVFPFATITCQRW